MSDYIGKIQIDNGSSVLIGSTLYGTINSTSGNIYQVTSGELAGLTTLLPGTTVHIRFPNVNNQSNPQLKIGNLDAKPIHYIGDQPAGTTSATSWPENAVVSLTFDDQVISGGAWIINSQIGILGTAAYTDSGAYMLASGGTFTGNVDFSSGTTLTVPNINSNSSSSAAATKAYVDAAVADILGTSDAMVFKGTVSSGGDVPNGTSGHTYQAGWTYKITASDTYAGIPGENGDLLIAISDSTSGQTGIQNSHWTIVQGNIDGSLYMGSTNSFINGHILLADGTNGQVKCGGAITSSISNSSTSEDIPTSSAVAAFVEGKGYVTSSGVTNVVTGIGLITDSGNAITSTGTIKVKLKSETALTVDSAVGTQTTNRNYAIVTDSSGYLAVSVPWTDSNVTQNSTSANEELPILLKSGADTSEVTSGVYFSTPTSSGANTPTINPSTGIITAMGYNGLRNSDVIEALGADTSATSADFIFLHQSGNWGTLSNLGTIAEFSSGVLVLTNIKLSLSL